MRVYSANRRGGSQGAVFEARHYFPERDGGVVKRGRGTGYKKAGDGVVSPRRKGRKK